MLPLYTSMKKTTGAYYRLENNGISQATSLNLREGLEMQKRGAHSDRPTLRCIHTGLTLAGPGKVGHHRK